MAAPTITAERLRELFLYNPETGKFTIRTPWKYARLNTPQVGCQNGSGYLYYRFEGRAYRMHRLAWLYVYGELPPSSLDHINGARSDNRISNLRLATHAQNNQNRRDALGASLCKKTGKWRASISVNKKTLHLGVFESKNEAHAAYLSAKREMHPFCTI